MANFRYKESLRKRNKIEDRRETERQEQKRALEQIKRLQEEKAKLEEETAQQNANIEREIRELLFFLNEQFNDDNINNKLFFSLNKYLKVWL